ncbi:tetratricopeptide repeat protein, partial [Kitasatospora sp. Root107]|uniref:tetratricopeptide repeat protein n=1 Tax=Kitasatospora sp. Root107 TaxID=1736424 RepID=UPI00138EF8C5
AVGYNRWIVRVAERITDGSAELHRFRASALERIGVACSILGRADQAVEYMSAALTVYRQLGRRTGMAINHNNLSADYLMAGRLTEAEAHLAEALEIHRSAGARRGEAAALINLGVLRHRRGDLDAASLDLSTAQLIDRDLGHLDGEAAALVERSAVATGNCGRGTRSRSAARCSPSAGTGWRWATAAPPPCTCAAPYGWRWPAAYGTRSCGPPSGWPRSNCWSTARPRPSGSPNGWSSSATPVATAPWRPAPCW